MQHITSFSQTESQRGMIDGAIGQLEIMTTWPKQLASAKTVAIVCHPHPLHQGTMDNKVVTTLAKAFDILGMPTVRFNYRGVGNSDGSYGDMSGESDDLRAVIQWVQQQLPGYEFVLAGFSFGSFIAANIANEMTVKQLVTIAPAVNHADFNQFTQISCPWLVVQGEIDEIVPFKEVQEFVSNPPSPLKFVALPNVTHFFHGRLVELRELIVNELSSIS